MAATLRLIIIRDDMTLAKIASWRRIPLATLQRLNPTVSDPHAKLKPGMVIYAPNPRGFKADPHLRVDRIEKVRRRVAPRFATLAQQAKSLETLLSSTATSRRLDDAMDKKYGIGKVINGRNVDAYLKSAKSDFAANPNSTRRSVIQLRIRVLEPMAKVLDDAVWWHKNISGKWRSYRVPAPYVEAIDASYVTSAVPVRSDYDRGVFLCWDGHLDALCKWLGDLVKEVQALYDGCRGGVLDLVQYQLITAYAEVLAYLVRRFQFKVPSPSAYYRSLAGSQEVARTTREVERLMKAARAKAVQAPELTRQVFQAVQQDAFRKFDGYRQELERKVVAAFRNSTQAPLKDRVLGRLTKWEAAQKALQKRTLQPMTMEQIKALALEIAKHQRRLHMAWYLALFAWHDWKIRKKDFNWIESWFSDEDELYRDLKYHIDRIVALYDADDYARFESQVESYNAFFEHVQKKVAKGEFAWKLTKELVFIIAASLLTWGAGALAALRLGRTAVFAVQVLTFTTAMQGAHTLIEKEKFTAGKFGYELFKNALLFGALTKFHGVVKGIEKSGRITSKFALAALEFVGSYAVLSMTAAPFFVLETYHAKGKLPDRKDWVQFAVVNGVLLFGLKLALGAVTRGAGYVKWLKTRGVTGTELAKVEGDISRLKTQLEAQESEVLKLERELLAEYQMTRAKMEGYKQRYRGREQQLRQSKKDLDAIRRQLESLKQKAQRLAKHDATGYRFVTPEELQILDDMLSQALKMIEGMRYSNPPAGVVKGYLTAKGRTPIEVIGREVVRGNVPTLLARRGTVEAPGKGQTVKLLPAPDPQNAKAPVEGALDVRITMPSRGMDLSIRLVDPRGEGRPGKPAPALKGPAQDPTLKDVTPETITERLERLSSVLPKVKKGVEVIRQHLSKSEAESLLRELDGGLPRDNDLTTALEVAAQLKTPEAVKRYEAFVNAKGQQGLVEWAKGPAQGLTEAQVQGLFHGELKVVADALLQTPEQIDAHIAGGGNRTTLRYDSLSKVRNIGSVKNPPFDGFVLEATLKDNQASFAVVQAEMKAVNPDVILGMERGGALLAEIATHGDAALAGKVIKVAKSSHPKYRFDPDVLKAELEKHIAGGKKKIAFIDAYMGGRFARELRDQVLRKLAMAHPQVEFDVFWLRETFGFEKGMAGEGMTLVPVQGKVKATKPYVDRVRSHHEHLPLVLGDDMDFILDGTSTKPIRFYDADGHLVRAETPRAGETSKQLLIRLIWGK